MCGKVPLLKGGQNMETVSEVKPKIGMSVSMGIGSDSYHEIIVKMERNAKTIYTMSSRIILGGIALDDWNALPESIKAKRAVDAMNDQAELFKREFPTMREGWAEEQQISVYTQKSNGRYSMKGCNFGWITLDCTREYLDPSF